MTLPSDSDLLAMAASGDLAKALSRRFDLDDEAHIQLVEIACARLHNGGQWDLIAFLESGELQALPGAGFFLGVHMLRRVLPELQTDPSRMMACVEALVAHGGGDFFANQPNAALRAWCEKDPARAQAIIDCARAGEALACRNLTFALETVGSAQVARSFLSGQDGGCWRSAITALGRIPDPDGDSRAETISVFFRLAGTPDTDLDLHLLHAAASLISQEHAAVGQAEFDLIDRLVGSPRDQLAHAAAGALRSYRGARQPEIARRLLGAIRDVDPTAKGTVQEIDYALVALCQAGQAAMAIDFIKDLFAGAGALELAELKGFLHELTDGPAEVLARAVVTWLLSGEVRVCEALSVALSQADDAAPILNVDDQVRGLSGTQQHFLCRKAIGWFLIKPRTAASILISVLRVCDEDTAKEVERYLVEPLLRNYGGLRDYFESLDPADPARPRVTAALAQDDGYLAGLRGVPQIKELSPSDVQRRVQQVRMADQGRDIQKQARKHSVFYNLVKRSVVLHGRRSRSLVKRPDGTERWIQMELQPHSFGFELPRMEIVDPVGLDYLIRVFRLERLAR